MIDYLSITEISLNRYLNLVRPSGGVFFIDEKMDVYYPVKDKYNATIKGILVYAGNIKMCCFIRS